MTDEMHINARDLVIVLHAALNLVIGRLLELDFKAYTVLDGKDTPPICTGNITQLPWAIEEYGCIKPVRDGGAQVASCKGAVEAYQAYSQWCAPKYCVVMDTKNLATGVLGTVGGLWSVMTLVCFTIAWPLFNAVMQWCYTRQRTLHPSNGDTVSLQAMQAQLHTLLNMQSSVQVSAASVQALHQQVEYLSSATASLQLAMDQTVTLVESLSRNQQQQQWPAA
jgi:hypothetical protein